MQVSETELQQAWDRLVTRFPFPGYLGPLRPGTEDVARTVSHYLPVGSRVLDFGAGPADKTAVLATLGYACTAMDDLNDEWHVRGQARQMILDFAADMGVEFIPLDRKPVPSVAEFDMVMLHSVLQHLHESPRDLLVELVQRIRTGGYLFITVPNHVNLRKRLAVLRGRTSHAPYVLYYWYPGQWRGYVREYTRGDCTELAKALGLELVEVRGVHHMLHRLPPWVRPVYVAASRLMPSTRDTWLMVARKPAAWTGKVELDDQEFRKLTGLTSWSEVGQ
jgi:SAM-dependent methyltransferase